MPAQRLDTVEESIDFLQRSRFYQSGPVQRIFINYFRRKDGKAPFPWLRHD